jgi:hypothetical protein
MVEMHIHNFRADFHCTTFSPKTVACNRMHTTHLRCRRLVGVFDLYNRTIIWRPKFDATLFYTPCIIEIPEGTNPRTINAKAFSTLTEKIAFGVTGRND